MSHVATSTASATTARPLRVLQFAYGSSLYGAERWILALCRNLEVHRVETVVAAIDDGDSTTLPLVEEANRRGLRTWVLDGRENKLRASIAELRRCARAEQIDIVHSHGTRQDIVALLASRGEPFRTLSTPHGWDAKASLNLRVQQLANRWIFPLFDAVAPLSQGLVDSLRWVPIGKKKLRLIPNGVDLDEVEAAEPVTDDAILPDDNLPTIAYIGQLIPRKGLDVLLRGLEGVRDLSWRCLIVGDGPLRGELELEAQRLGLADRVHFTGFRSDRLGLLKRCKMFAIASYLEGIPRVCMEAMGAGLPVVGSDIPGVRDLVSEKTGYLFPAGEAAALTTALRAALVDGEERDRRGNAARELIYERHSAQAMAREYERLYAEMVPATQPEAQPSVLSSSQP